MRISNKDAKKIAQQISRDGHQKDNQREYDAIAERIQELGSHTKADSIEELLEIHTAGTEITPWELNVSHETSEKKRGRYWGNLRVAAITAAMIVGVATTGLTATYVQHIPRDTREKALYLEHQHQIEAQAERELRAKGIFLPSELIKTRYVNDLTDELRVKGETYQVTLLDQEGQATDKQFSAELQMTYDVSTGLIEDMEIAMGGAFVKVLQDIEKFTPQNTPSGGMVESVRAHFYQQGYYLPDQE